MIAADDREGDLLIDVSRLVWRVWRGALPTGIDRVCIAYLQRYRSRGLAVLQRRGRYFVLPRRHSERLFAALLDGGGRNRARLLSALLPVPGPRPENRRGQT